jgi:hypothetical protein
VASPITATPVMYRLVTYANVAYLSGWLRPEFGHVSEFR